MAELKVRIEPEDIVKRVVEEVAYKGRTIAEWADALTNPKTNADRIRSMTNEELAKYLAWMEDEQACYEWRMYGERDRIDEWLEWLREEYKSED